MPQDPDIHVSEVDLHVADRRLHCKVARPATAAWARVAIVHGYGDHAGRYMHFMRWLAEHGVSSEAIDLRGHGRSSGRRGFVSRWPEYLDDLEIFLSRHRDLPSTPQSPLFLLGHSHGGLTVAAAGQRGILSRHGIAGVILASPYLATRIHTPIHKRLLAHVAHFVWPSLRVPMGLRPDWLTSDADMKRENLADVLRNRIATPRWYITTTATQIQVVRRACDFTLPVLCLTGESDVVADPAVTAEFFSHLASPDKSLYTYPGRVHELLRETDRETAFKDILAWIHARAPFLA